MPGSSSFQSTPANFTAGDASRLASPIWPRCFNPRPPISQRATGFDPAHHTALDGFNPRPPISQRATRPCAAPNPIDRSFQSTPANFTAGDPEKSPRAVTHRGPFQSTPANFTAGDLFADCHTIFHVAVSIHARQFHSGRLVAALDLQAVDLVSIHARQFHSGRRWLGGRAVGRRTVSIHARQFHSGRPGYSRACTAVPRVSIHARQFHSGRLPAAATASPPPVFQSTPANFTAGDLPGRRRRGATTRFNPRPPISQRATGPEGASCFDASWFQSTPANFTAGDARKGPVRKAPCRPVSIHARQFHSGRPGA